MLLAACSGDSTEVEAGDGGDATTTTTEAARPGDANALVLQIHTGGGFVPIEYSFGGLPEFTLYGDGRVIVHGPTTMEFPGAALPNLLTGTIDEAAVGDAVRAARDAGVTSSPDLGQPLVADAPTTTFVLVDGGRTTTLEAYALGIGESPGLTSPQQAARRRLSDLTSRMINLGEVAREAYEPTAVSVLVQPPAVPVAPEPGPPEEQPIPTEADWPLADLATGGRESFGGRCLGFTGAEAEKVLDAAGKAKSNTRWRSGGATFALVFRPELPNTEPCAER